MKKLFACIAISLIVFSTDIKAQGYLNLKLDEVIFKIQEESTNSAPKVSQIGIMTYLNWHSELIKSECFVFMNDKSISKKFIIIPDNAEDVVMFKENFKKYTEKSENEWQYNIGKTKIKIRLLYNSELNQYTIEYTTK